VAVKEARRANGSTQVRFERIRQLRAHEYVAEQIRRHIALRLIKPGEALPAERELAGMFGVGRPTIQHALRLLEATGLVEARRGRSGGTFITHPDQDSLAADDLIVRVMRQRKELEDLLLFRRLIEPAVARVAAGTRSSSDIEAMRRAIGGMEAAETCGTTPISTWPSRTPRETHSSFGPSRRSGCCSTTR
jgi:GntR family transcriptional repressor for pyruvate dehydrogenase complex